MPLQNQCKDVGSKTNLPVGSKTNLPVGSKTNLPSDAISCNFRNSRQENVNTPDLKVKICGNKDHKITNAVINKQCRLDFFRFFLCSIFMDTVFSLLSVLPISDGLNLLKQVGVSVVFVIFVLERFTPDLSGSFKLTTSLESTI